MKKIVFAVSLCLALVCGCPDEKENSGPAQDLKVSQSNSVDQQVNNENTEVPERLGSNMIFVHGEPMSLEEAEKVLPESERPNVDQYGNPLFVHKTKKK